MAGIRIWPASIEISAWHDYNTYVSKFAAWQLGKENFKRDPLTPFFIKLRAIYKYAFT